MRYCPWCKKQVKYIEHREYLVGYPYLIEWVECIACHKMIDGKTYWQEWEKDC